MASPSGRDGEGDLRTEGESPLPEPDRTLNPFLATPPDRETVAHKAYRLLREAMLDGRISPGTRINELELASAWNISRTPIRDALRRLEAEGLVVAVPGRGVVVPRLSLADAEELYELREVLEGRAARRCAERATPEAQSRLNALVKAFGAALRREDLDRMTAADLDLHAAIAHGAANRRLEHAIQTVCGQVHLMRLRTFRLKGRGRRSLGEMARLVAAVRAHDADRAEAAMREHIASLRADLVEIFTVGG